MPRLPNGPVASGPTAGSPVRTTSAMLFSSARRGGFVPAGAIVLRTTSPDGRASIVAGTHTHAPTADLRILPGGTAFMSDVGMTGDYDSVIGMTKEEPLQRFLRRVPSSRFETATGPATLCGLAVETDAATGLAQRVSAVRLGGCLEPAVPAFWS